MFCLKYPHLQKAPKKCRIFSVSYGQDINPLKLFSKKHKINHTIQNLQNKTSYQTKYRCSYINQNKMSYYFADGTPAPCCFMVDVKNVKSKDEILEMFSKSIVPKCCEQCDELVGKSRLTNR